MLDTRWRKILFGYALLLVISNVYRFVVPAQPAPEAPMQVATVVGVAGNPQPVQIAYQDVGPRDAATVVALHGSPSFGSRDVLLSSLSARYRVIAPDLPGFGASSLRVPDYSSKAHAAYLRALLDQLEIGDAHLFAYSMGGAVALEAYALRPDAIASMTLLSSIGVQELELFGDYTLNHAVHAAQLGFFRAVQWLTPHFGWLDSAFLNATYARNFYDTDQRPLRDILTRVAVPVLIIHGEHDVLVPISAAIEHHRIVPQSELVTLDGGHGLIFTRGDELGTLIADFVARVENGAAMVRDGADPVRVTAAAQPFDWNGVRKATGISLALILLVLILTTYVSEDLACIAAGLLVANGVLTFWTATIGCLVGIYTGDALVFWIGRQLGSPMVSRAPMKWLMPRRRFDAARVWFEERGPQAILISRFIPGTRFPTYIAAGMLGTSFWRFSLYFLIAAVVWTPLLVGLAALVGDAVWDYFASFQKSALPVLIVTGLVLYLFVELVLPAFSPRGRRLLLSRWRRLRRWEFWPPYIFYLPVVAYIIYLGLRHRCMTLFTAANPAIPAGGFVGESKADILRGLSSAGDAVATTTTLPDGTTDRRVAAATQFMRDYDLDFPLVLKPDIGERGSDVCIARSVAQMHVYLEAHSQPTLAQAYAPGHEFGVFYVRKPDATRGFIFAITDKRPPQVTGDGVHNLEHLILHDERAVCSARHFLNDHASRLHWVPEAGERFALVEIGTHCKGCAFYDGAWVKTPQLENAIDALSLHYDDFYFGRYDIRTPSIEDFRNGENFKVVELNGVTSEATNIYDPGNSLISAYRTLAAQWRLAFEIGEQNRRRGVAPVTIGALLNMLRSRRANNAP